MQGFINPEILHWAITTKGIDKELIAKKLNKKIEDLENWLKGKSLPTFKQAQKLAKILDIPFGYLFLKSPPKENLPIPDFRTIKNKKPVSSNLKQLLLDLEQKVLFLEDFYKTEGYAKLNYIGIFDFNSNYKEVANFIKKHFLESEKIDLKELIENFAKKRIFVFRNGLVGNNTHRKIDVNEIRGAVYVNEYAPIVFINSNDSEKAQIFTLIHELVHVLINQSEFSDISFDSNNKIEIFCNKVAAEVLMPTEKMKKYFIKSKEDLEKISNELNVSKLAILYRMLNLGKISKKEFEELKCQEKKEVVNGGNFYFSIKKRYTKEFIKIVKMSVLSEKITYKEGSDLLGVRVNTLNNIFKRI